MQAKHIALHLPLLQDFMLAFLNGMHAGNKPAGMGYHLSA